MLKNNQNYNYFNLALATFFGKSQRYTQAFKQSTFSSILRSDKHLNSNIFPSECKNNFRHNFYRKRTYSKIKSYLGSRSNKATWVQTTQTRNNFAICKFPYIASIANTSSSSPQYIQLTQFFNLSQAAKGLNSNNLSFFANVTNNTKLFSSHVSPVNGVSLVSARAMSSRFRPNLSNYINKSLIDFLTSVMGTKAIVQFYPFLANNNISSHRISFYKTWVSRLEFYQKRLGHRFFMEETIHIMHLALNLHDSVFFSKWLASLIKRISFWKTRSIFRYLLYLFNNFFVNEFSSINCKGLKLRLKGKISAAGNSRKRLISLNFGKTSYSTFDIKCSRSDVLVPTFTGVLNLRVEIFY